MAIGIAAGLALALALTRYMASLLYDVKPNDPLSFVLPVLHRSSPGCLPRGSRRRAAAVDPVLSLRWE